MSAVRVEHLYVHVPFCTHICPYCAFHKERNLTPAMNAYLPALSRELEYLQKSGVSRPRTVFFGGGTPSALGIKQLEIMASAWPFPPAEEFTLESNPATITPRKAALLRRWGVNRISLGVQSFDPAMLQLLGRVHTREQVRRTVDILRDAGFDNINIDLMFSLPGQSPQLWEQTLTEAIALNPEHVSAYNLTYEEDTDFLRRFQQGEFRQEEETNRRMFDLAADMLEAAGLTRYEVSNFATSGQECRHNQAIWDGNDYAGAGPSACSTIGGTRLTNISDTMAWAVALLENGGPPPRSEESLTPEMRRLERLGTALRTRGGLPAADIGDRLPDLVAGGLVETDSGRARLTREGMAVADSIAAWLA